MGRGVRIGRMGGGLGEERGRKKGGRCEGGEGEEVGGEEGGVGEGRER